MQEVEIDFAPANVCRVCNFRLCAAHVRACVHGILREQSSTEVSLIVLSSNYNRFQTLDNASKTGTCQARKQNLTAALGFKP